MIGVLYFAEIDAVSCGYAFGAPHRLHRNGDSLMPRDPLEPIRAALENGDKPSAQALLRPLLKERPTAELWYLAAIACSTKEKAIQCLRKALELEPQHSGANRMLHKLEGAVPKREAAPPAPVIEAPKPKPDAEATAARPPKKSVMPALEKLTEEPLKKVKRKRQRGLGRTILLLSVVVMAMGCSLVTMNLAGIITGPVTLLNRMFGGGAPVTEIDGVPLDEVPNAPVIVRSSFTKPLNDENRDANVLDPGYAHEYTFSGHTGDEMAVYVQFLSLAANRVSRNVVVLRPDGSNATSTCERDAILQGDNNITLTCAITVNGTWRVRILGRDQESVGAYFVGVQPIRS
jgi:hypothetical protein